MGAFHQAQAYIKEINKLSDVADIGIATKEFLASLGFSHFACCSHVDYKNMPSGSVLLHNYPYEWTEVFREMHLEQYDPILRFASYTLLPFHWGDPRLIRSLDQEQAKILNQASKFGLKNGYTVPIHLPGHYTASLSAAGPKGSLNEEGATLLQLIAPFLYQRLRDIFLEKAMKEVRPVKITDKERLFLSLVAQGKSDWAISKITGASVSSVSQALQRVRQKLDVATRTQAVTVALHQGYLSFEEVVGGSQNAGARIFHKKLAFCEYQAGVSLYGSS